MNRIEFFKPYRDPRWQKKRLEIFRRDNFTCRECNSKDIELHCHHCFYETGLAPWDYPDDSLLTLCSDCHEQRASEEKSWRYLLRHFSIDNLWSMREALEQAIVIAKIPAKTVADKIHNTILTPEVEQSAREALSRLLELIRLKKEGQ